jgi:hypothetical protein
VNQKEFFTMNQLQQKLASMGLAPELAKDVAAGLAPIIEDMIQEESKKLLEDQIEEHKQHLETLSDNFIQEYKVATEEKTAKLIQDMRQDFVSQITDELKAIETKVVTHLDTILEDSVSANFSTQEINKIAMVEIYEPVINGIRGLFQDHAKPLDETGLKQVDQLQERVRTLEDAVNAGAREKHRLSRELESAQKSLLFEQKTSHLPESQRAALSKMFQDADLGFCRDHIEQQVELLEDQVSHLGGEGDDVNTNPATDIHPGVSSADTPVGGTQQNTDAGAGQGTQQVLQDHVNTDEPTIGSAKWIAKQASAFAKA